LTELLGFFDLSSISIYNEAKTMNFTIFGLLCKNCTYITGNISLGEKIKISLIYFDVTLFSYKNI
jgi:hypothetical protein